MTHFCPKCGLAEWPTGVCVPCGKVRRAEAAWWCKDCKQVHGRPGDPLCQPVDATNAYPFWRGFDPAKHRTSLVSTEVLRAWLDERAGADLGAAVEAIARDGAIEEVVAELVTRRRRQIERGDEPPCIVCGAPDSAHDEGCMVALQGGETDGHC